MNAIRIDVSKTLGEINPLHGINNGPLSYGALTDTSEQYREAGIPIVRLHDTDWPNPYNVDLPKVFPDMKADPDDPAAYQFSQTDDLIAAIYQCGSEPLYRLGVAIEHIRETIFARKPADYEKMADICVHVIRHYNEGWNNGFHYGIRFWEVWNEPDLGKKMWDHGTPEDYFEYYCVVSKKIKQECPDVLVGGYGAANPDNMEFMKGFFEKISAERAPLDFLSWHKYSNLGNIDDYVRVAEHMRALLNEYGYPDALSICDEWNYMSPELWKAHNGEIIGSRRKELFDTQKGMEGASFSAALMIALQNHGVYAANLFDGQPHMLLCAIFDMYACKTKTFYAFKAYNEIYSLKGRQLQIPSTPEKVHALAAKNGDEVRVLLANHDGEDQMVQVEFEGLREKTRCSIEMLDEEMDLIPWRTEFFNADHVLQTISLRKNTVCVIRVTPA